MRTVATLDRQFYSEFELCLVIGPTDDGSAEFAEELATRRGAKVVRCPERNISMSRNMGINRAAGELVAFLDDDALPEPVWLEQLIPLFRHPRVGGASGLVFHSDSRGTQFRYSFCDRFGAAKHVSFNAPEQQTYPQSPQFPHVMGANCMFSRSALIEVGGFDEEYEYYLDEADLCCRLIDAGYKIVHADWAPVHHKYLSGTTRDGAGITVRRKTILKNQMYFSLKNARGHASLKEITSRAATFTEQHRADIDSYVRSGRLPTEILNTFDADAEIAWEAGITRGLGQDRQLNHHFSSGGAFQRFAQHETAGRPRHVAVIQPFGATPHLPLEELVSAGCFARSFEVIGDEISPHAIEGADLAGSTWLHRISPENELPGADSRIDTVVRNAVGQALERVAAFHPFDEIIDLSADA